VDNVTHILAAIDQRDVRATDELLPVVYNELRLAAEAKPRDAINP
jgi:hypothetical protein